VTDDGAIDNASVKLPFKKAICIVPGVSLVLDDDRASGKKTNQIFIIGFVDHRL
jgi:hypothetical protein